MLTILYQTTVINGEKAYCCWLEGQPQDAEIIDEFKFQSLLEFCAVFEGRAYNVTYLH